MNPSDAIKARQTLVRLDAAIVNDKRALTTDEQKAYDDACNLLIRHTQGEDIATLNRTLGLGDGPNDMPTFGEQLLTRGKAALGALGHPRYGGAVAEAEDMTRALQHGVVADGTQHVTIEGDLIKFVDANRYAVNVARRLPMPGNRGKTFTRPRVTQLTQVGTQAAEGDVLASRRLQTTGDTVTKVTKGGTIALSEQEIDWTEPELLGLTIEDLAEQYAIDTDLLLTAAIEAKVTSNVTPLELDDDVATFLEAIVAAAAAVFATSKRLPNTLYVDVNRWAYIVGLTDAEGRPVFNTDASALGGLNVAGLTVVADPNFSANTAIVAASNFVEFYEQEKGLLGVAAPSTLETIYAYRGYVAANVYAAGLQGLEPA